MKDQAKQLSIRLSFDIYDDLITTAKGEIRTVNNLIAVVLTNYLNKKKSEESGQAVQIIKEENIERV